MLVAGYGEAHLVVGEEQTVADVNLALMGHVVVDYRHRLTFCRDAHLYRLVVPSEPYLLRTVEILIVEQVGKIGRDNVLTRLPHADVGGYGVGIEVNGFLSRHPECGAS